MVAQRPLAGSHRLIALQRQFEVRDETKILIEERLAAVMRNEDMLKVQVAALQEHFQIVESQVLHEGRVPALIAATGSTASTITNIALTTEALAASSLNVLQPWGRQQQQSVPFQAAHRGHAAHRARAAYRATGGNRRGRE